MRHRISIRGFVRRSVCQSVGLSVCIPVCLSFYFSGSRLIGRSVYLLFNFLLACQNIISTLPSNLSLSRAFRSLSLSFPFSQNITAALNLKSFALNPSFDSRLCRPFKMTALDLHQSQWRAPTPCVPHRLSHTVRPTPCVPHRLAHTVHPPPCVPHRTSHTLLITRQIRTPCRCWNINLSTRNITSLLRIFSMAKTGQRPVIILPITSGSLILPLNLPVRSS